MANRKNLKQGVKCISEQLLTDCLALDMAEKADKDELRKLIAEILALESDTVARINHTEPGNVKQFYRQLRETFAAKVADIASRIVKQ